MTFFYRVYQTIIVLPLFLLATILTSLVTIIGCSLGDKNFWAYWPGRLWACLTLRILFLPVNVSGREKLCKEQSYVFVANHQGAFDIFLIYGFLHHNFKWMMKRSLFEIPFVGAACRAAGFIKVDKSGPSKVKSTYDHARAVLNKGMSVVVFAEGSRTFTGHMGAFKRGAFILADELRLPVVPITINGSFNVKPRQKDLWWVYWHPLSLTIHQPIMPSAHNSTDISQMRDQTYQTVMSALSADYQGFRDNPDKY